MLIGTLYRFSIITLWANGITISNFSVNIINSGLLFRSLLYDLQNIIFLKLNLLSTKNYYLTKKLLNSLQNDLKLQFYLFQKNLSRLLFFVKKIFSDFWRTLILQYKSHGHVFFDRNSITPEVTTTASGAKFPTSSTSTWSWPSMSWRPSSRWAPQTLQLPLDSYSSTPTISRFMTSGPLTTRPRQLST